jgi:hypothetical protein
MASQRRLGCSGPAIHGRAFDGVRGNASQARHLTLRRQAD